MIIDLEKVSEAPPVISVDMKGAEKATGLKRGHFHRALNDGTLTGRKAGGKLIFEMSELQRHIQSLPFRGREPVEATP
jgi:hypothetical protein